jgi:pimeloyl-ACP methyl ester carboxylesterase
MNTLSSSSPHVGTPARVSVMAPDAPGYLAAGAGTPVVMLHASLSSKSQWTGLAQRLASRYRVIALDLFGYGDNPLPVRRSTFTVDDEVRLVSDRVDQLVPSHVRVHVVGHSYGGLVALRWAQCRSDRVASVAVYEPVVFRMLDDDDTALAGAKRLAERISRLVAAAHRHEAARTFVDFWSGEGTYASLSLRAQASIARRVDKLPLDFQAAACWPLARHDLREIITPTLLLTGTRSPAVVQRVHALLARTLPNRWVGSFDSGHMGPINDAYRVNPWFEAFVDRCASADDARTRSPSSRSQTAWASAAD